MLAAIDWLVIALIIVLLMMIVKRFSGRIKDAEGYYIASKGVPFSLLVGTLVASWYGGPALLNQIETAAVSGLAAWGIWSVGSHAARIPLALWVAPEVCVRTEMTIPQMMKRVYGQRVSFVMAIYMLITLLSISEIVALKNVVMGIFGTDAARFVPVILIGVVVLTITGGMLGVAVTDMLLFFCMSVSVAVASSILWHNIGGWNGLEAALTALYQGQEARRRLNPVKGSNMLEIITLLFISTKVYVHANLYQRFSAADSPRNACRSYLVCFCIFVTLDFLLTICGLVIGVSFPNTNIAQSFIHTVCSVLPAGLRGIFVVGLLGAIISTLDSVWLACGMMIANDIIGAFWKMNDRQNIAVGKISIAFFACLGYLGAFYFTRSVDVTKFFGTMTMSVQFVMGLMMLFYKGRKSNVAAWASMICGGVTYFIINFCFPIILPIGKLDGAFIAVPVSLAAYLIGSRFGTDYSKLPMEK